MGGHFAGPNKIPGSDGMAILAKKISVSRLDLIQTPSVHDQSLISFVNNNFAAKL